jgi:hypothetical protein
MKFQNTFVEEGCEWLVRRHVSCEGIVVAQAVL